MHTYSLYFFYFFTEGFCYSCVNFPLILLAFIFFCYSYIIFFLQLTSILVLVIVIFATYFKLCLIQQVLTDVRQ